MDYEHHSQQLSQKRNGQLPQSLPQVYTAGADESNEQTLDMGWLFAVVRRRIFVMIGVGLALSVLAGALLVRSSRKIIPEYEGSFRLLVEPITAEGRMARLYLMAQTSQSTADIQRIKIEESTFVDYETLMRVLKSPKMLDPVVKELQAKYPKMSYNALSSNLSLTRISVKKGSQEQGTKILVVSYNDIDGKRIEVVLENIKKAYLDYSLQERLTSLRKGIEFINQKLPPLQAGVDKLQQELQSLRQEYNVIEPQAAGKALSEHALSIDKLRLEVQAQLAESRTLYANLQKQLAEGNSADLLSRNAKTYETLIGQIQKLESQIALDSATFLEDSEPMLALREKQENMDRLAREEAQNILQEVAGQIRELEARARTLEQTERIFNQKLRELPAFARKYDDLQRELEVSTKNLKEFLSKREILQIDAARQEEPWEVIQPPQVPRDEKGRYLSITVKKTKSQLVVAVIVSMLLGIGAGFLVEVLHTVFHTPEEVKAATKLPLLGVVPFAKEIKKALKARKKLALVPEVAVATNQPGSNLVLGRGAPPAPQYQVSPVLEAFRSIYTNIRLLRPDTPVRSLVIGAATPGEGKSTLAFNLAQTAAAIGQRVLLVDADMRNPKIHTRLGLPNARGLSDAIVSDISLNDAIQRSPLEDNLFVLTAGAIPSDPIKLLSSKKMESLMEQFQDFFDLVIYDTPPLVGLADGSILAAHTDGIVLVVGLAQTDRSLVTKALDGLKISGTSVLGVVANNIKG